MLLDVRASHNLVDLSEAARLGLKVVRRGGRMKAVNSKTMEAEGLAKNVPPMIGK